MKYLKTYEENTKIHEGEYCLVKTYFKDGGGFNIFQNKDLCHFIDNNIGIVTKVYSDFAGVTMVDIYYKDIPNNIDLYDWTYKIKNINSNENSAIIPINYNAIKYHSFDKDDVLIKINTQLYNI